MKTNSVKKKVAEALFKLLETKKIESIQISDLVKEANVARSSFYHNFLTINNVLEYSINEIFTKITSSIEIKDTDIHDYIKKVLENTLPYKKELSLIYKRNLIYILINELTKGTIKSIKKLNVYNNYYQPYYYAGASAFIYIAWIKNNFKDSPEKISQIYMECLNGGYLK